MTNKVSKLNPKWVSQTRKYFPEFLKVTKFPLTFLLDFFQQLFKSFVITK